MSLAIALFMCPIGTAHAQTIRGAAVRAASTALTLGVDSPARISEPGLARGYPGDRGVKTHPDVLARYTFGRNVLDRQEETQRSSGDLFVVGPDWDHVGYAPMSGSALAFRIKRGEHHGGSFSHRFAQEGACEQPESIGFRYYLRFGSDWDGQHGKLPGFGGTYNRAGWGGRRSDGKNGWSARGCFRMHDERSVQLGTYCYHADMQGDYGDTWKWTLEDRGLLELNRWYCIEQHLRLNTPGERDGVIQAWVDGELAFDKRNVRFRDTDDLKIERIWCNVYHGGKVPAASEDHLFIDNLVIAKSYIGPIASRAPDER